MIPMEMALLKDCWIGGNRMISSITDAFGNSKLLQAGSYNFRSFLLHTCSLHTVTVIHKAAHNRGGICTAVFR